MMIDCIMMMMIYEKKTIPTGPSENHLLKCFAFEFSHTCADDPGFFGEVDPHGSPRGPLHRLIPIVRTPDVPQGVMAVKQFNQK